MMRGEQVNECGYDGLEVLIGWLMVHLIWLAFELIWLNVERGKHVNEMWIW